MIVLALLGCGSGASKPAEAPVQATVVSAEPVEKVARVLPALVPIEGRPDDCTLDIAALSPLLAPDQGRAEVRVERKGRVVETFSMPDGTPVRVTQIGCEHIGITEEYGIAAVPDALYPSALALSGRLKHASSDSMSLHDRLVRAKSLGEDGSFDCGDASCRVVVHTEGPNPVLEISYDFAL
ncbi:MAG: hypothetical protein R3F61_27610 [Myxococcota bacterium]